MSGSSPRMWGTLTFLSVAQTGRRFIPTHVGNTPKPTCRFHLISVHPHACGEHLHFTNAITPPRGSSPRMWGTLRRIAGGAAAGRFIPTHVGNTVVKLARVNPSPVHPHACGEHVRVLCRTISVLGSSPRMWGTRGFPWLDRLTPRFIPTHVGNTEGRALRRARVLVHPHACGEHLGAQASIISAAGSSPRMWGTHLQLDEQLMETRFIPTHVGNTSSKLTPRLWLTVHPHACGEHVFASLHPAEAVGSSPRMWGTQYFLPAFSCRCRFIPTHVGNTTPSLETGRIVSVHPHACGEHAKQFRQEFEASGSSPRMWGTHVMPGPKLARKRFIPTHVGNTRPGRQPPLLRPVHPHACGEHPDFPAAGRPPFGSSPRMWGTH